MYKIIFYVNIIIVSLFIICLLYLLHNDEVPIWFLFRTKKCIIQLVCRLRFNNTLQFCICIRTIVKQSNLICCKFKYMENTHYNINTVFKTITMYIL